MTSKEHMEHSANVAIWSLILFIGSILWFIVENPFLKNVTNFIQIIGWLGMFYSVYRWVREANRKKK